MVVSELALGLITNALYDSAKKIPGIRPDPSKKAYNNAVKEFNKKYGQSGEKVNTFLHQENIKAALREYLANPKSHDLLKSLTDEFLTSFYSDNFSQEYAKSILSTFFEILDSEIEKDSYLRTYLQLYLTKQIHQTEKETNEVVQETHETVKEVEQVALDIKQISKETKEVSQETYEVVQKIYGEIQLNKSVQDDNFRNELDTDFEEAIREYLYKIISEDREIGISEVYTELSAKEVLPITLKFRDEKDNEEKDNEEKEFEVLELVKKEEKLIISGESGSGKTTTLKWLNVIYAANFLEEREEIIPLYIELNSYIAERSYIEGSFYDYVEMKAEEHGIMDSALEGLLMRGKIILLLDGLDLLSQTEEFFPYMKISDFISKYFKCRFVISSRPGFFESIKGKSGFKVAELEKLTDKKIQIFIDKYVPDQNIGEKIKSKILSNEQFRSILTTPMMLYLTIEVAIEREGNNEDLLPSNRSEMYEAFVSGLFTHYEIKTGKVSGATRVQINNALSELYFRLQCGNEVSCGYENAQKIVGQDILEKCLKLGLLSEKSSKIKKTRIEYGIHQSFQEYFAAIKLKEYFENGFDISETFSHPRWEQVVIYTSEMVNSVDEFIEFMVLKGELFLASKCSNEASDETKERLCSLLAEKMDSGSELEKIDSIKSLVRVGTLGSSIIAEALEDEDVNVCRRAVMALSNTKSETAVQLLINALRSKNINIRKDAAEALGNIKSETAVKPLINLLKYEEELGVIKSETTVERLIIIREYGEKNKNVLEDTDVWRSAYRALIGIKVEIGDVQFLINEMKDDSKHVRRYVAGELGRIKSETIVKTLIKALKDEDGEVRWTAAETLGKIRSDRAIKPLIIALRRDDQYYVRQSAAEALGEIKSDRAVTQLILTLSDNNEFVRESAVRALGKIKSDKAVQPLIDALNDKDQYVRKTAADALGELKSEKAVLPLINAMGDKELDEVEYSARWALEETVKSDEAVQLLINALNDENHYVRNGAASVLEKTVKSDTAIQLLRNALSDENKFVRESAASILEKIGTLIINTAETKKVETKKVETKKIETKKIETKKVETKKTVGTEINFFIKQPPYRTKVSNNSENVPEKKHRQSPEVGLRDANFGGVVDRLKSTTDPITIVDYICGEGKFLRALTTLPEGVQRNISYIGVDISTKCRYISRLTGEKLGLNKKLKNEPEFLKPKDFSKKDIAVDYVFFTHALHEIELLYLPDIVYSLCSKVKSGGKIFILDQKELVEKERSSVLCDDENDFEILFKDLGFKPYVKYLKTSSGKQLISIEIEKIEDKYFTKEDVSRNCLEVYKTKQVTLME